MNKIQSVTLYREYIELIEILPEEEQKEVLFAIKEYIFNDRIPELSKGPKAIFFNLKRPLDKSKNKSNNAQKRNERKDKEQGNKSKTNQNQKQCTSNDVYVSNYNDNYNYVVNGNVNVNKNIYEFIEEQFGRTINPAEYELIGTWSDNEVTRMAIKEACLNHAYNVKYVDQIIRSYRENGISNLEELLAYQAKRKNKDTKAKQNNIDVFDEVIADES